MMPEVDDEDEVDLQARQMAGCRELMQHLRNFQSAEGLYWPDALSGSELEAVQHLRPAAQCRLGARALAFMWADERGFADVQLGSNIALLNMYRDDFDGFRDAVRQAIASEMAAAERSLPPGATQFVSFDTPFDWVADDPNYQRARPRKLERAWARVRLADGSVAEGWLQTQARE